MDSFSFSHNFRCSSMLVECYTRHIYGSFFPFCT
uniref:Uncharacterized protein n=1 Tax=Rhizophora mucronata TaxID=61149 RepID=A0A2P2ND61_RHIMU